MQSERSKHIQHQNARSAAHYSTALTSLTNGCGAQMLRKRSLKSKLQPKQGQSCGATQDTPSRENGPTCAPARPEKPEEGVNRQLLFISTVCCHVFVSCLLFRDEWRLLLPSKPCLLVGRSATCGLRLPLCNFARQNMIYNVYVLLKHCCNCVYWYSQHKID